MPSLWPRGMVISTRQGGDQTCGETAYERMVKGEDVLDSLIAGVNIYRRTRSGRYQCRLWRAAELRRRGAARCFGHAWTDQHKSAVASIEGVRTPSLVAKRVMEDTDHHLIVGQDAQRFARVMGFKESRTISTPSVRGAKRHSGGSAAPTLFTTWIRSRRKQRSAGLTRR